MNADATQHLSPVPGRAIVLLGGGGHAAVVADAARAQDWNVIGFFDDDPAAAVPGLTHLGSIDRAVERLQSDLHEAGVHASIGDADVRRAWYEHLNDPLREAAVIHPTAERSSSATIGSGVFIAVRSIVNARALIGRGAIINSGAIVEHDCRVGPFAHIAPGATLGGDARVGRSSLIGIGATVLPGVEIGERAIVGAGAVVTRDVPDNVVVIGLPARVLVAAR